MAAPKKSKGFTVAKPFRDSDEYVVDGVINRYEVGVDVSHLDADRLKKLEERGLVVNGVAKPETETTEE